MKAIGKQLAALNWNDNYFAVLVFILAAGYAWMHFEEKGLGNFYQHEFSPAITLACNGTYQTVNNWDVSPANPDTRKLHAFLNTRTDSFDCEDLPGDKRYFGPPDIFQSASVYLIGAAGLLWAITGIAWSKLTIIGIIFVAAFAAGLYRLCRLFVPGPLALIATVASFLSPIHLDAISHLRDYSKAPFIVWSLYLVGAVITTRSTRSLYLSCALCGLVSGVGFGFRTDLLLVPIFVMGIVPLFILANIRRRWKASLAGLAIFAFGFVLTAFPALMAYSAGAGFGHVALLGLTVPFDAQLALTRSVYDIGSQYNDAHTASFVYGNAFRYLGAAAQERLQYFDTPQVLGFLTPLYSRMSTRTLFDYVNLFPADMLVRFYASSIKITTLNFGAPSILGSPFFENAIASPYVFLLAVVALICTRPALGVFLACFVAFFAAAITLQFDNRHAFYLIFVPVLSLAIVFTAFMGCASWLAQRFRPADGAALVDQIWSRLAFPALPEARTVAAGLGVVAVLFVGSLLLLKGLRHLQQTRVAATFTDYLAAPRQAVPLAEEDVGDQVLLRVNGSLPDLGGTERQIENGKQNGFYIVATIDPKACAGQVFQLEVVIAANDPYFNSSRTYGVFLGKQAQPGDSAHFMFPILTLNRNAFDGFRILKSQRQCLRSIEAVRAFETLSLPLWITLWPGWQSVPLFQTVRRPPWPFRNATGAFLTTNSPDLKGVLDPADIVPLPKDGWTLLPPAHWRADTLAIRGTPKFQQMYAAVAPYIRLTKGEVVAATGIVNAGGLTFGLLDDKQQWATNLGIGRGPFSAIIQAPSDGNYSIVFANNLTGSQQSNDVVITKVGRTGLQGGR